MPESTCRSAASYVEDFSQVLAQIDVAGIESFSEVLFEAWLERRQVFFFGNGGSASTASHHVLDLVKTASVHGQHHLRAMGMNDNIGIVTAVSNDIDYVESFSMPLAAYSQPGDVAVAISCSGNSPNIVHACNVARSRQLTIVGLTGFDGGKVRGLADLHINIPSDNYGIIEDLHLSIGHMVAQILRNRILQRAKESLACKV
jgi:D-sedoheptulose 7-phosphate isomerase